MPHDTFKKIHACSAGNFGVNNDKIPKWVKANGGRYSRDVHDGVTHLVTTEMAFKGNIDIGMGFPWTVGFFFFFFFFDSFVSVFHSFLVQIRMD